MSRRSYPLAALALLAALTGSLSASPISAFASSKPALPVKVLTCADTTVARPKTFVITCADGNASLTATHWSTWSASGAVGTTRFALNLCTPYCAASKMSYFPHSTVRLTRPVTTKHGRLYSRLVVHYLLKGKATTFSFSWSGDPSF